MKNSLKILIGISLGIILCISTSEDVFATNQVIHNFATGTNTGWNGNLGLEYFPGLTGGDITKFSIKVNSVGAGHPAVRAKIYSADGDTTVSQTHANVATHATFSLGFITVEKFTGLTPGKNVRGISLQVFALSNSYFRAKVFSQNASGYPGTLLGETNSQTFTPVSGIFDIPINATVPSDGVVWAGIETNSSGTDYYYSNLALGNAYDIPHTYGPGPAIGKPANDIFANPWMRLWSANGTGGANTLLGESNSTVVTATGIFNFTLLAHIPTNGNIWAGFETNDTNLSLYQANEPVGTTNYIAHNYGPGPTKFGFNYSRSGGSAYMAINYNPSLTSSITGDVLYNIASLSPTITFTPPPSPLSATKNQLVRNGTIVVTNNIVPNENIPIGTPTTIDSIGETMVGTSSYYVNTTLTDGILNYVVKSNTLVLSIASNGTIPSNGTKCGISGCPVKHVVTYSAHRNADFSKLHITAIITPTPFGTECLITNGTFLNAHRWYNFTGLTLLDFMASVPKHDSAGYICYGSGVLFSGISPGNGTIVQQGANVFNGTFGEIIGIPAGMFIVVLIGSLGNQRTGPIYLIASLAVAGILATVGFFVLETGWWVMSLIFGMLGLLVGRKVF